MAISLLQDAQTRSLAAALAGIKREDLVDRSLSMSPPMSANSSASGAMYHHHHAGLQQAAAASAFGMLSPTQLLAANRQAAAAFMAAQLPSMSTLASTLFPHHPAALFGSWGAASTAAAAAAVAPHLPLTSAQHSPPASPHSPLANSSIANVNNSIVASGGGGKHNLSSPTSAAHGNSPGELPAKKPRKLTVKKDLISPPMDVSLNVSDLYSSPGPISPPSSGSSPNSTHDGPTAGVGAGSGAHKDPSRDKSFTCKTCHRSFGYKHVLQNHERTHTGEKPFECPECHKRFTRDHHLKTHMRLHTGEKPYHCSHCDRQFVQVANLRRHLRVHTGERPYTCEICEGKFSDSNQLKSHMLVHNGEKPFECERCHMKFRRRHHLLNHKCGIQSPPTPAISPAMSGDYPMCDQKSVMGSSYGSEESMELGVVANGVKSAAAAAAAAAMIMSGSSTSSGVGSLHLSANLTTSSYELSEPHALGGGITALADDEDAPLDLSEDGGSIDENGQTRSRKSHDIRRVFRLPPPQIVHVPVDVPEQTEPEDLSMHSPRSHDRSLASSVQSPDSMMHDDLDLDELDDAAALYLRQQQRQQHHQQLQLHQRGMQVE